MKKTSAKTKTTTKPKTGRRTPSIKQIRDEYEKKIFDLRQLIEIGKSLNSTLEYAILIDSILYICMGQMKVLQAGVFTWKGVELFEYALHRNYKGFDITEGKEYIISRESKLVQALVRNPRCYTMEDVRKITDEPSMLEIFEELNPGLIVPLRVKDHISGILILGERIDGGGFSKDEKEYVINIAGMAAIAIHNAYLFEVTTTDMMTKLRMRHFFLTALTERMDDALVNAKALSLIMMDIDHFKNLNDTYGHTCGDAVLKQVAKCIIENVRQIDIAARYGGEEFSVILPDADLEEARVVAERIRSAIETQDFEYDELRLKVTISLGVAQYRPVKDTTSRALIDRADKALYFSKQNGRNRVFVSE